jgi:hypothetical protein
MQPVICGRKCEGTRKRRSGSAQPVRRGIKQHRGELVAGAEAFLIFGLLENRGGCGADLAGTGAGDAGGPRRYTAILARGAEPFYACAATNIRSYRAALAAGFLPVCSDATVTPIAT